jgi:hypothetical protein
MHQPGSHVFWRKGIIAALGLLAALPAARAASVIPDAPAVAPAPILDKPLTPATNDAPDEQPTAQHVWVPGHWRWSEGAYVWESGRWEVPPTVNVSWVPPRWEQQGNGYVLKDGYWDETPATPAVPATPRPPQELVINQPPPPPQREVIPERPTAAHVWIPGHWGWQNRHVWIAGRWETPPRANVTWVPPRWETRGTGYVLIEGYWRDAGITVTAPPAVPTPAPQVVVTAPPPQQVVVSAPPPPQQQVIVVAAPPPPRHEVVYRRPGPGYVWVNGYWLWQRGRYVWVAGHWATPPRGYRTWEAPRWERRGGNYIFFEGRWGR